jgi:tRNA(Ile)-lysidine synthase
VAASGGRDSTALLHCAARSAREWGVPVHALHVHHGLHPDADAWLARLRRQVARWRHGGLPITLHVRRLDRQPPRGASVEAWARGERYAALVEMARQCGCRAVLLAHHRRDQAETVLLQLLRGAGPAALAAMPSRFERGGIVWHRPWLDMPRDAIEAYVERWRLSYVDDGSNLDTRFARNRLRQAVWPRLLQAFPEAEAALAGAAARAQEAAKCLRELAAADLAGAAGGNGLAIGCLEALGPSRRANALREWLRDTLPEGAPESLVQRLLAELPRLASARWPAPGGELAVHRGRLNYRPAGVRLAAPLPEPLSIDLSEPGRYPLPQWGGTLLVEPVAQQGLPTARLARATCRSRSGGERFQLGPQRPPRSLKKQYQALGVAAWERHGPLVYLGSELAFAPGLGIDARQWAHGGEPQRLLRWERQGSISTDR